MEKNQDTLTRFFVEATPVIAKANISHQQFLLLNLLVQTGEGLTMREVTENLCHTAAAATGMVDRLCDRGYVQRNTVPGDRRKIEIVATGYARELVKEVYALPWAK